MLEEKGTASPESRGILPAGAGTCSCTALALQGVWDQGTGSRGAPIPRAQHKGTRGKPCTARVGWGFKHPAPHRCSLPTLQPQLLLSTTMEEPMVPIPPLMDKLKVEPAQTGPGFMDARESHPSTPGLSLVLKWMFCLGFFKRVIFLILEKTLILQQSPSCLISALCQRTGRY